MKNAVIVKGDCVMRIPIECLKQQTCLNSIFECGADKVDKEVLIELNGKEVLTWHLVGEKYTVGVETDKIIWEA